LPSRYKTASSLFMNEFAVTTPKPKDVPRPLAKRSAIDPFIVMDVMGEANARELEGHDIIHMEVGQPATPAPRAARERAQQALESERLGYTEALVLPKLRERVARHLSERYGVGVTPERVVVTAGSSAGFVLAFLALKVTVLACRRPVIRATARPSRLWMSARR
jgi:DNA-binding transcriptional MocR family regulator